MYCYFISLGLPCQNVREIDLPSPVEISDSYVAFRNIRHLFISASSSPWITLLIKYSIK